MAITVKICGLKDRAGVDAVAEASANLAGFIFYPPSPRYVGVSEAATLARALPSPVGRVAVTVDADDALLDQIAFEMKPDYLQFHGSEPPERLESFRQRHGIKTIKAFAVRTSADMAPAVQFQAADLLLFDAKAEGGRQSGGGGKTFDWGLMAAYHGTVPWLLSGGLTPDTVVGAVKICSAFEGFAGVDVSSGVERPAGSGDKDPALIRAFVARVRAGEIRP